MGMIYVPYIEKVHIDGFVCYIFQYLCNIDPIYNQPTRDWYNRQRSSHPDRGTEWMYTVGVSVVSITSVLLVILVLIPPCVITSNINIPVYCVSPELCITPEVKFLCNLD